MNSLPDWLSNSDRVKIVLLVLLVPSCLYARTSKAPPFYGSAYLGPEILTATDPTALADITYKRAASTSIYDRRHGDGGAYRTVRAYLFDAQYRDGLDIEVQVNAEFGSRESAAIQAREYATIIGRIPTLLRRDIKTLSLNKGYFPAAGGNGNIMLHVEHAEEDARYGNLEEVLMHEAAHVSLDRHHENTRGWRAAQRADDAFITEYARDFPRTEDVAETIVVYIAIRYLSGRLSASVEETIKSTIPNRISYFDSLKDDFKPRISDKAAGSRQE